MTSRSPKRLDLCRFSRGL